MNPSANGWIKKLLSEVSEWDDIQTDTTTFYQKLKETGFVYGSNVDVLPDNYKNNDFTDEERCKINLLLTFYFIYKKQNTNENFTEHLIRYYKSISNNKRSFFEDLFGDKSSESLLEKLIHKRIYIDDNLITKTFNYFLINALLFVDILGYQRFLKHENKIRNYVINIESALETIVFSAIDSKTQKSEYDTNLIRLFEDSVRHKNSELPSYTDAINFISEPLEKLYLVDLVCMALWSDKIIDAEELEFLDQLKTDLQLDSEVMSKSVEDINVFYETHKDDVAFLRSKNLAQSFYDNSSKVVSKLIKRNSKRLIRELSESKEAMALLAQSTQRNLTDEEQKKIQSQLLDIFKSIPSLAIFMLPGGMILLPLFVKFIPKLLPSAFDENRIEDD
ncbi:LETM1-related biofilm-associated protein [Winogradskyella aquimaris]|uniref:LETM1-related biofilm-associated protein n=1 Tax=Winogradskyella aquimaris TaxID=864074 RepID=A0ABU5ETT0_9FLAO|nr:LETM1-related biofilm-associated protein [Winogradskyella aquimaris]MDY2588122.1 LETM1-related biofilm-associated protein [Winogradskyella aquimaris]